MYNETYAWSMIENLIVIEGLDGSGKATQAQKLVEHFKNIGKQTAKLSFPVYESNSSALVRMYLNKELSDTPEGVNPYAASAFYAVDRCAHFLQNYNKYDRKICIADRYTSSNIIYQTSKLPKEQWDSFIDWCEDFEYNKLGIPKPNKTVYLDMPIKISQKMMSNRYNQDESKKDLHESNIQFLQKCRETALYVAKRLNWEIIKCNENDQPKTIQAIHEEIVKCLK